MKRRNFIRNAFGLLVAAPMVVKAESLMPIVSETYPKVYYQLDNLGKLIKIQVEDRKGYGATVGSEDGINLYAENRALDLTKSTRIYTFPYTLPGPYGGIIYKRS